MAGSPFMKINPLIAFRRVSRARSAVGKGTLYKLGKGGYDPKAAHPADKNGFCDCTGFGAWVFEINRDRRVSKWWMRLLRWKRSPWFESTNVYRDATANDSQSMFVKLPELQVGAGLVYGDRAGREGHFAVIVGVNPLKIIECRSRGNREAIMPESDGRWMVNRGAIPVTFRSDVQ